jgi:hypothetical protein
VEHDHPSLVRPHWLARETPHRLDAKASLFADKNSCILIGDTGQRVGK